MTQNKKETFIQEYLYIEEVPLEIMQEQYIAKEEKKSDEGQRGVVVINLLGDDEE